MLIAARYETKGTKTDVFKHLYRHFRGGAIVFDDCREYIVGNRLTDYPYLKKLLSAFRHMELDLFFVMHGPADVPRQTWNYVTTTFVGHTNAIITPSDVRSSVAEEIIEAQRRLKPEFIRRKAKGDGGHYGLFVRIDS